MHSLRAKIIDRNIFRNAVAQLQSHSTTSIGASDDIQIPPRKERGPTDILRALDSTISRDPTAPDYKFIDDPFLIPTSLNKKRIYSLSKESGKRAAKWILQEHADLLKSNLSEPLIYAFLPPEKYNSKDQVSEEILMNMIKLGNVANALHVYNLLEKDVSKEAKQAMLELLCFYNNVENQKSEEFPEESSYQTETPITKNSWINNADIEQLFGELQKDKATAPAAYNAVICGTAKYLKIDRAWSLYNECLEKNIPLSAKAYNHIITLVPILKGNNEERKILLINILQTMSTNGVKPNIGTLNAALKTLSIFSIQVVAKDLSLQLIADFKNINIKPSLASFYYLLLIFCRSNGSPSNILKEIIDELESREKIEIEDPNDIQFFVNAMEVASKHMFDLSIGNRLHKLLLSGDNYKLLGGRLNESIYYRNYLQLIMQQEPIEDFIKIYNYLVPHIYIPEPALMRDILEILDVNDKNVAMELLPKFASQIIMFDMLDRHQIMKLLFKLMITHCTPPAGSPLHKQFAKTAWTFWNHQQEVREKRRQRSMWPVNVFCHSAVLMLRGDEFEKMLQILEDIIKSKDYFIGTMDKKALKELFDSCIVRGHVPGAFLCIEYASDFEFIEADSMVQIVKDAIPLSEAQENQLAQLIRVRSITSKKATQ